MPGIGRVPTSDFVDAEQRPAKRRKRSFDDEELRKNSVSSSGGDEDGSGDEHKVVKPAQPIQTSSRIKPKANGTIKPRHVTVHLEDVEHSNGKMVDRKSSFATVNVAPWLLASLAAMEVKRPTAIQKACIPEILTGKDVIGGSKTGSGKTIAFAVPILQKLAENPRGIFGLVLTPTRELALQIYEQFQAISYRFELKAALVTGGADWIKQTGALKEKPHLVIATPGRLADLIRSSGEDDDYNAVAAGLKRVQFLVLDEADRLLAEEAGMLPDVETCVDALPPTKERQTCLFTATMTPEVLALKDRPREKGARPISVCEVNDAEYTAALGDANGAESNAGAVATAIPASLQVSYLMVPVQYRDAYLHVLLQTPENTDRKAIIVFANKTSTANVLERLLRGLGHSVTSLHSQLRQYERTANLARFRAGVARILVATDVASRGLDIPDVSLVVNYDVPAAPDDYIHRSGRTARAGRGGQAVTLVGPRDEQRIAAIEARIGRQMTEYREQSDSEMQNGSASNSIEARVIRDDDNVLRAVGETKRAVLIDIDERRDVRGNRNATVGGGGGSRSFGGRPKQKQKQKR